MQYNFQSRYMWAEKYNVCFIKRSEGVKQMRVQGSHPISREAPGCSRRCCKRIVEMMAPYAQLFLEWCHLQCSSQRVCSPMRCLDRRVLQVGDTTALLASCASKSSTWYGPTLGSFPWFWFPKPRIHHGLLRESNRRGD